MGLQTGVQLARTTRPVIDPSNLQIVAYEVDGPSLTEKPSLLRIEDIREISDIGMIIDSADEFINPADVIKIEEIYDLKFLLEKYPVIDQRKSRLGRVLDYTIDPASFRIQQLTVKRPVMKSFNDSMLLINRSSIKDINDTAIVIRSETESRTKAARDTIKKYSNPFKQQSPSGVVDNSDVEWR